MTKLLIPCLAMMIAWLSASAAGVSDYPALKAAFDGATAEGSDHALTEDIEFGDTDTLTLPAGTKLTLDLAGHRLGVKAADAIRVYGALEIVNSSDATFHASLLSGRIVNAQTGDRPVVHCYGGASFTLAGGLIGRFADLDARNANVHFGTAVIAEGDAKVRLASAKSQVRGNPAIAASGTASIAIDDGSVSGNPSPGTSAGTAIRFVGGDPALTVNGGCFDCQGSLFESAASAAGRVVVNDFRAESWLTPFVLNGATAVELKGGIYQDTTLRLHGTLRVTKMAEIGNGAASFQMHRGFAAFLGSLGCLRPLSARDQGVSTNGTLYGRNFNCVVAENQEVSKARRIGLPCLFIDTVGDEEPTCEVQPKPEGCFASGVANETKVPAHMVLRNGDVTVYDSGEYEKGVSGLTVKIRGNTSAMAAKKPYKLKLQKKVDLLFRGDDAKFADKEWVLLASATDLKNTVGFKVNELLGLAWTPGYAYVNVVMNGTYRGLYMIVESEKMSACRVNITKQGFLYELDAYWWLEDVSFKTPFCVTGFGYTFKYPDTDDLTNEQLAFIREEVRRIDDTISASGDYKALIDVPSWAAWLLGADILGISDGYGSNMYFTRADSEPGTLIGRPNLWDFDSVFGRPGEWAGSHRSSVLHYKHLIENPDRTFNREYVSHWRKVRGGLTGAITSMLDGMQSSGLAAALDAARVLDGVHWSVSHATFASDRKTALDWFAARTVWIDEHLSEMPTDDEPGEEVASASFGRLKAAVDDALTEGSTCVLTEDVEFGGSDTLTVPAGTKLTLDLAGHRLGVKAADAIKVYGELEIVNSSDATFYSSLSSGRIVNARQGNLPVIHCYGGSTLVLTAGLIGRFADTGTVNANVHYGTAIVIEDDAKVKLDERAQVRGNPAIEASGTAEIAVCGGKAAGNPAPGASSGVIFRFAGGNPNLTVNGGAFNCQGAFLESVAGSAGTVVFANARAETWLTPFVLNGATKVELISGLYQDTRFRLNGSGTVTRLANIGNAEAVFEMHDGFFALMNKPEFLSPLAVDQSVEKAAGSWGDRTYNCVVRGVLPPEPGQPRPTVEIDVGRPMLGVEMTAETSGEYSGTVTYAWIRGDRDGVFTTEVGAGPSYAPQVDDLEHWVRFEARWRSGDRGCVVCRKDFFVSRLPVLYMTCEGGDPTGAKETHEGMLRVQGNAEWGESLYDGEMEIKVRGNSTSWEEKKPYKLKLGRKSEMFGMASNKHWVLIASYFDPSLMRNKLASDYGNAIGTKGMNSTWVDCVLNGRWIGTYVLFEHIRVGKKRIDVYDWEGASEDCGGTAEDLSWIDPATEDISGGYLFELSKELDCPTWFIVPSGTIRIKTMVNAPEYLCTNPAMVDYCKGMWQDFWDACTSDNGYANGRHYTEMCDLDSMLGYWLTMEVFGNHDARENSRYAYKDRGAKLKFGPVWDFDRGVGGIPVRPYGPNNTRPPVDPNAWTLARPCPEDGTATFYREWTDDPYFCTRLYERYWERHAIIENIVADGGLIDTYAAYLAEAGRANHARWPYNASFETDVAELKDYLRGHLAWLDAQFATVHGLMLSIKDTTVATGAPSTCPYTCAHDVIPLGLHPAVPVAGENLKLVSSLGVSEAEAKTLTVEMYVNGILACRSAPTGTQFAGIVPAGMMNAAAGMRNVIQVVVRKPDGTCFARNHTWAVPGSWVPVQAEDPGDLLTPEVRAMLADRQWTEGALTPAFRARYGDDLMAAAFLPTGKTLPDGTAGLVWHDYVAGVDPLDPDSAFKTLIGFENGELKIGWWPDLGDKRVYTVEGSMEPGGEWHPRTEGDRFFRARVALP